MRTLSPALALNLALVACDDFIEKANAPVPTAVQYDLREQLAIREEIQDKVYECRHLYPDVMSNTGAYVGEENLTVTPKPEEVTCMDANGDGYVDGVKKATDSQAAAWFYDPMLHRYMKEEGSTPQFDFTVNQLTSNPNHAKRMAPLGEVLDREAYCSIEGKDASTNWLLMTKEGAPLPGGLVLTAKGEPLNFKRHGSERKQYRLVINVFDEVTGLSDQVVSEWECN